MITPEQFFSDSGMAESTRQLLIERWHERVQEHTKRGMTPERATQAVHNWWRFGTACMIASRDLVHIYGDDGYWGAWQDR